MVYIVLFLAILFSGLWIKISVEDFISIFKPLKNNSGSFAASIILVITTALWVWFYYLSN